MRVGDMTLHAADREAPRHAAAAADLDHVAELGRRGRLADDAVVERLAARLQPLQHFFCAVDRNPFFIAGDQETDRAWKLWTARRDKALGRGDKGGDRALHVDRAAPAQD